MADHRREQILDAVKTTLTGLATTGANVFRLRVWPQESAVLPSWNIVQGEDVPLQDVEEGGGWPKLDRSLQLRLEGRVKATADLDQTLNEMTKEATVALRADHTLGLGFVHDVIERETEEPEVTTETEQPSALLAMNWEIRYRTSVNDPSA